MSEQILTSVAATVDADREAELTAGFRSFTDRPLPEGLIRSELLRGQNGNWRLQSLCAIAPPWRRYARAQSHLPPSNCSGTSVPTTRTKSSPWSTPAPCVLWHLIRP